MSREEMIANYPVEMVADSSKTWLVGLVGLVLLIIIMVLTVKELIPSELGYPLGTIVFFGTIIAFVAVSVGTAFEKEVAYQEAISSWREHYQEPYIKSLPANRYKVISYSIGSSGEINALIEKDGKKETMTGISEVEESETGSQYVEVKFFETFEEYPFESKEFDKKIYVVES